MTNLNRRAVLAGGAQGADRRCCSYLGQQFERSRQCWRGRRAKASLGPSGNAQECNLIQDGPGAVLQVSANSAPPVRGFLIISGGSLGDMVALFRAGTFTGGTTLCADLASSQRWLLLYSFRLPHLPAMDMATAIIIGAMSKTIGTIVSTRMLRSAVVGGAVVGGATAKALAGGELRGGYVWICR